VAGVDDHRAPGAVRVDEEGELFATSPDPAAQRRVMLVMDAFTRRIIGFGVESADIDGVSACRMFNRAVAGQRLPKHVITDHDPLFRFHRWLANLRVLAIEEVKSLPYAPVSNPFIERLIGTIRRQYLDRVFFWNAIDLTQKLDAFAGYCNMHRVHRSLRGTTPTGQARASSPPPMRAALHQNAWEVHCRGLFHTPIPA
jgi:putative transposase